MSKTSGTVVIEPETSSGAATARPGTLGATRPDLPVLPGQKCPFLAGRPPHGSYHLWPSGVNVCYARGAGEKSYGHVGKETQQSCCFAGAEMYEGCSDYSRARGQAVSLPVFDGAGPSNHRLGPDSPARLMRRERVKRRQRRSWFRNWWRSSAMSTLVCACWVLLGLVAFWLVLRSM